MSEATTNRQGMQFADRFASEARNRWQSGQQADVSALLQEWPDLQQHRSVVLDLAYHEYTQRLGRGESLSAEQFSRRFPSLQRSLFLLIQVRQLLSEDGGLKAFEDDVTWPEVGEDFVRFRLLAELGRGTFGRVYLASEPALGNRLVALKVALGGDDEADMLGRLRHENVVPVHSVQKDPNSALTAICMPYLGRTTLCDVLDAAFMGNRPPSRARVIVDMVASLHDDSESAADQSIDPVLRHGSYVDGIVHLAVQLSDALAYAHEKGICHRDLKPSNVLVSHECRPLLLDFNLSFDDQGDISKVGGTLPYMAPEQLAATVADSDISPSLTDRRSDLFSLGVIFYELLSGTLPFGTVRWESSFQQTARFLLEQQANGPRPLWELNGAVDRHLAAAIHKCLAYAPDDRPASAAELADTLRKELTPIRRTRRWASSHRKLTTGFAVLLVAAIASLVLFLATRAPYHVRQFQRGQAYLERAEYDLAIEALDAAVESSPDPTEALYERGRAYAKSGKFRLAVGDFEAFYQRRPIPKGALAVSYCLNRLKYHKKAVVLYRTIDVDGELSAVALNNMGFSFLQLGDNDNAEQALKEAVQIAPHLQAVHYNLAILYLRLHRMRQPLPPSAYSHITRALEIGPPSSDLYRLAAAFCMIDPNSGSQAATHALDYLEKGIPLGLDRERLKTEPLFRPLKDDERFQRLLNRPPGVKTAETPPLIDPL